MTTLQLATELEVARRTVMRDIDALTEAGLPIVMHRGNTGGVELGFNFQSRLVGLAADEAEALGVILALPQSLLAVLGMESAARLACGKLVESMPEVVRRRMQEAQQRFRFREEDRGSVDPRVPALAAAVRSSAIVRIHAKSSSPRTVHPIALEYGPDGWAVIDGLHPQHAIPLSQCGDINVSAKQFTRWLTAD